MTKPPRIAVVGSAVVDLTVFTDAFPRAGETIFGKKFDLGFGGKGANQAVAAKLCGAEVSMVCKVGNDLFGPATIRNFEAMGIDAKHVGIVEGMSSGVAPIFVDSTGQNRIVVVTGANDALLPADVDAAADVLKASDCIVLQFEVPLPTVYHTIRFAKTHGIRCILNPAPGLPAHLKELASADYFIPNENECEVISGIPVHSPEDARKCAEFFLQQGIRRVVITRGEKGSLLASPDGMELISPFPVKTLDSTGAGDAFIGSFSAFLSEGIPERESLRRASLYAAISTTKVGTQKSFISRADFEAAWSRVSTQ